MRKPRHIWYDFQHADNTVAKAYRTLDWKCSLTINWIQFRWVERKELKNNEPCSDRFINLLEDQRELWTDYRMEQSEGYCW